VVEHSPHHPLVEGSSPAVGEKTAKKALYDFPPKRRRRVSSSNFLPTGYDYFFVAIFENQPNFFFWTTELILAP
jgi:hypothetical protein